MHGKNSEKEKRRALAIGLEQSQAGAGWFQQEPAALRRGMASLLRKSKALIQGPNV